PLLNQKLPVFLSLRRQPNHHRPPRPRLLLRNQPFLQHCSNRPVHHGPIKSQQRSNLVLIPFCPAPQRGQDKSPRLRTPRPPLQLFAHRKISRRQVHQHRILQNLVRNHPLLYGNHRIVTVDSSGRRHCGCSTHVADFFPMAITITISWYFRESPRNLESRAPSNPSIGQVLNPSDSAAIIKLPQASAVLFVAHWNNPCRETGAIPMIFRRWISLRASHFAAPKMLHHPCR